MKSLRPAAMAALVAGSLSTSAVAQASFPTLPNDNGALSELFDFCTYLSGIFPQLSMGECMGYNLSQGTYGFVPHICDELQERGLLDDFGFETFSDCVLHAR